MPGRQTRGWDQATGGHRGCHRVRGLPVALIIDKDGNVTEVHHGHAQSTYPSKSVTQGDLTKLKRGVIGNIKKQRVLPPPCEK
jgi:hypothetical protein